MSLLTPYEAIKYSTAGKDYPTAQFCEVIPQVEEEFARKCLGQELYDYMVASMAAYPTGATEWNNCQSYDTDETVVRNGCLFYSTSDANRSDPLAETGDWAAFERFTTEGANLLWTKYLRRILAIKCFMTTRFDVTYKSGPGGTTVSAGDNSGFRAANKAEMMTLKEQDIAKIEQATENMLYWLSKNAEAYEIPTASACTTNQCQTRGKRVRRWAFTNHNTIGAAYEID